MSRAEFLEGSSGEGGVVARARNFMSGDAQFFSAQPNLSQIRKQLDNEQISAKKEAMKRVIAQICLGNDMSALFPDVVKNIHAASIELRKLVYYFIVHYSEERPNEALLSISAFQHDLVDQSMHVRALALRTLSSVRIAAVNPVVLVAIKKCSTDLSPLVRRTAAIAVTKANRIARGEDNTAQVIPVIHQLLGDRSMDVVGAAAATFMQICPDRHDLVHKHFRRICRGLLEADEWAQVNLLQLLLRYARHEFVDPNKIGARKAAAKKNKKKAADSDASSDDDTETDTDSDDESVDVLGRTLDMDSDHRLLLQSVKPLFHSLNRAVVLGAAALYFHVAPESDLDTCAKPLLRLLGDAGSSFVALIAIQSFLNVRAKPFVPYIRDFFLAPTDSPATRQLRLKILARLVTKENQLTALNEVRSYLRSYDMLKVVDAVRCLGQITFTLAEATPAVIRIILPLLSHKAEAVVTESVVVLRQLVVQSSDKTQASQIVQKLAQRVLKGTVTAPSAKSSIIWLVGEHIRTHPNIAKMAPDFFRLFVKSFKSEATVVKAHVITLGLKIWLNLEGDGALADRFKGLFFHLLELVRYDADYDIRDQGRVVHTALSRGSKCFDALKAVTMGPKPLPQQADTARQGVLVGSMSHVLGTIIQGYEPLAEWPAEMPDPHAREPPEASSSSAYSSSSDDSDASSTASSDDASSDAESVASSSASDDDDSSSDSDAGPKTKPPARQPAKAPAKAPVKVKIVAKVLSKPGAAPAAASRDRVVEELFTKKAQHADPEAAAPAAPAGPTWVDAVETNGLAVAYTVKGSDVRLRFTNTTDSAMENIALATDDGDDESFGDFDAFDLPAGESHEAPLTVSTGFPAVATFTVDGDDDVPVRVTIEGPSDE
eukprot:CAMPEP_0174856142 /NCGR_PEP_ID=MMETSP1114-20130205/35161_1 /TAXON_ID=312471 /ORGANISM="Neobodo designis, Strain CCAP 1951/1" /LENGTH=886 /DNA_ID=CAMNT_0016090921 /DNA_START=42 /DNA_END=2702 /DNA_ORIENTATION=+